MSDNCKDHNLPFDRCIYCAEDESTFLRKEITRLNVALHNAECTLSLISDALRLGGYDEAQVHATCGGSMIRRILRNEVVV